METKPKQGLVVDIRHLLQELARIQDSIRPLQGKAREQVAREWQEISDTLASKLSDAKYFRYDSEVFLKFLSVQTMEVVLAYGCIRMEPFNGRAMDLLKQCKIIGRAEYMDAVDTVLQEGGTAS